MAQANGDGEPTASGRIPMAEACFRDILGGIQVTGA